MEGRTGRRKEKRLDEEVWQWNEKSKEGYAEVVAEELKKVAWVEGTEVAWEGIVEAMFRASEMMFERKIKGKRGGKEWWTKGCKTAWWEKKKAWEEWQKGASVEGYANAKKEYRRVIWEAKKDLIGREMDKMEKEVERGGVGTGG
jgi:hypothetical protein